MNGNAIVCYKQLAAASRQCLKLQQQLDAGKKPAAKKTFVKIQALVHVVEMRLKAIEGAVK